MRTPAVVMPGCPQPWTGLPLGADSRPVVISSAHQQISAEFAPIIEPAPELAGLAGGAVIGQVAREHEVVDVAVRRADIGEQRVQHHLRIGGEAGLLPHPGRYRGHDLTAHLLAEVQCGEDGSAGRLVVAHRDP